MEHKKKYFKNNDKSQHRYFTQKVWSMLTPHDQFQWQQMEGGFPDERKFCLYKDEKIIRYFSERVWSILHEEEQDRWRPLGKDWPEISERKETKAEKNKRMDTIRSRHGMNNLKLRAGQKITLMSTVITIIRWGARRHLIEYQAKSGGRVRFGTLVRETQDTSYGAQDILRDTTNYSSHKTLESAELEFESANR